MLILLPPSESKTAPDAGSPADLLDLSFPQLTEAREAMLDHLADVSASDDALDRLKVGASLRGEVERNTRLTREPAAPAISVYTGVLYDALGYSTLSEEARARAEGSVVIVSALWGAVRPADRIPAYRLSMGAKVAQKGTLASWWKGELSPVLGDYGRDQLIIDCRSSSYAAAWKPEPSSTAAIRVERLRDGRRQVVSHMAKHYRGEVARYLLEAGADPATPEELAEILRSQWEVELSPAGKGPAELTIVLRED
jgi:cytoplasmic iron level regulating protein YaaA (DUF328/UPF0246 family)